jgi:hypothetical protein
LGGSSFVVALIRESDRWCRYPDLSRIFAGPVRGQRVAEC